MDLGVVNHKQTSLNAGSNETGHGSANLKHQRSGLDEESWKLNKMQRTNEVDFSSKKNSNENFAVFGRSNLWASGVDDGQKMLSFSSSEPHYSGGMSDNRSIGFSVFQDGNHSRTRGVFNEVMGGPFAKMKGPFTPSQWMELEHQALIYKHLVANVPVPSNLLVPLKRSLYSYGSSGSYASNFLGWGPFHLGYSGSNDPEPGRCRRTDGKKWRCSRDAVPDQKYCERHINRGRHRSRKPVEGHTGQAVSGSTTSKVETAVSSSSAALISSSKCIGAMQHQFNSLQSSTGNASTDQLVSRTQGFQGLGLTDPKSKGTTFSNQKQHVPYEESSLSLFGLVSSDSLVNPSERISFINTKNTDSFLGFNDKEANNQYPVHHFIDDWPKNSSDHNSASWGEELKSDWTQLSMSIPVAPDFSSSANSPTREKSMIPTLKLSHDLDPTRMSLGSWGSPMGGPLGEVLTSTTSNAGSLSSPKEWNNSPPIGSSPTGVLQKSTFVSLSNSSSGGSPPSTDKVTPDAATLCNALGSALVSSTAIPSL